MAKEHKEFTECPCLGANGGGESNRFEGSPTTSIALEADTPQPATFGYNTKHTDGTNIPTMHGGGTGGR
jgi:hypothetical protein